MEKLGSRLRTWPLHLGTPLREIWNTWVLPEFSALAAPKNSIFPEGVNAVALFPDEKRALSASDDQTLKLWDLASGILLTTFSGEAPMKTVCISPNNITIIACDSNGSVHFLSVR